MRALGLMSLVACLGLAPGIAAAGGRSGGPTVRDHRSSSKGSDGPTVRDHRSSSKGSDGPIVRDHRSNSSDRRDARSVRDHRTGGGRSDESDFFSPSSDPGVTSDDGSPGVFSSYTGPTLRFEMGGVARRFRGPAFARRNTVETTSGDLASYALQSGPPSAGDTAAGAFAMRLTLPVSEHLFAGSELELGDITRTPVRLMTDSPDILISSRAMISPSVVVGARVRHGIAELGAELAGGVRVVSMTMRSFDAGEDDPSQSEQALSGLVEARVRGAVWIAPRVYVAAQAGTGMLDRSDINFGLSLGISSRAFGARR